MIERPDLLKKFYRDSGSIVDFKTFAVIFGEWEFVPIQFNGVLMGVMAEMDGEIHLTIDPQYRGQAGYWRTGMVQVVQPLIDKYKYVTTTVENSDTDAHEFVQRLGFVITDTDDHCTDYMMSEIKFKRKGRSCLQQQ